MTAGQARYGGKSRTVSGSKGERLPLGEMIRDPTGQQAPTAVPAKGPVSTITAALIFHGPGKQDSVRSALRQIPGLSLPTTHQGVTLGKSLIYSLNTLLKNHYMPGTRR